jgi:non-heme chloroperoxidase
MDRRTLLKMSLTTACTWLAGCGGDATGETTMFNTTHVTTSDGVRLNVVEAGNRNGPAIVFVHGISQSWLAWLALLADATLRARYRLIAFDLRGHGASQGSQVALGDDGAPLAALPAGAYGAAAWAADLQAVIGGLALVSPTVVGWSYGGAVLLDSIAAQAGLGTIGQAVLLATSPVLLAPGTADGGGDQVFSAATFGALVPSLPANPFNGHANSHAEIAAGLCSFVELCFADASGRAAPSAAEVQGTAGCNLFTPPDVRAAIIGRVFDHRAMLAALSAAQRARLHVIMPLADQVLQPANIMPWWAAAGLVPDTVAGEGHLYHHRNAADFARRLGALAG